MTVRRRTADDKRCGLPEAAGLVADGDVVAIGGGLSHREPMALVRELIRQGRRDLHVVGSAHGIDVDQLIGAEAIGVVEQSYVGFEQDFGLAPAYRRAAGQGAVQLRESCCYTILQQLRAAEYGLPFIPVRGIIGSDVLHLHPEYSEITCPFTGQRLIAVPPLAPDVALIHGLLADQHGNVHVRRPLVLDERFAFASRRVVVTVERLASSQEVSAAGVTIPYFLVDAVVEAPYGAHPTSCYPHYTYDREHIAAWIAAAAGDEGIREYFETYLAPDECHYRDQIGEAALARLRTFDESPERWQELMA
ncbi:MAG: CoA transferase subunit A [Solirubrobacterales bacterium]|nr:CoA transferase subunit A [Solirubrobacterales bacterium]